MKPGTRCRTKNSFAATRAALALTQDLRAGDTVVFLLSGGGSALFEQPLVPGAELQSITGQLLGRGADIVRDQHGAQAPFGRQRRAVCAALRPGAGVPGRFVGHFGRPARYDRLRPGLPRHGHLRRRAGRGRKIPPDPERSGAGLPFAGNAQAPGQCGDARHRQRAAAVRRRGQRLPGAGATSRCC